MIKLTEIFTLMIVIMLAGTIRGISQTTIPDILYTGTTREQMNYLEEKTRIYENFRAIREDMFQLFKKNLVDSLEKVYGQIILLTGMNKNLATQIDSISVVLASTGVQLDEAVRTKNNINVLGIDLNKVTYNSLMWIIVAALLFILGTGFLVFKRNMYVTLNTRKDLTELKAEFEAYRQKTRLAREKMDIDHFNEIKKLRGGS